MVDVINRGRPPMTANERFYYETLYNMLLSLRDIAQHLNMPQAVADVEELLDGVAERVGLDAAAESSE